MQTTPICLVFPLPTGIVAVADPGRAGPPETRDAYTCSFIPRVTTLAVCLGVLSPGGTSTGYIR